MGRRVFLAGAGGAIGKRLVPLLLGAGHAVFGTTRSSVRARELAAAGIEPVVVDVFDAPTLSRKMAGIRPEIVIHQLTDLPPGLDPTRMADATARNARIRDEGTRNLVSAAVAAGVRQLIAQSIAWVYAPGPEPHVEDDPLDTAAEGPRAISIGGVVALERWTLYSPPLRGVVLRYGRIHGPGTGAETPREHTPLHVDAAASAALLAMETGASGIFNIAEPNPHVAIDKARRELGWDPDFRLAE
ncbi:MAG TPA: NAD(P)-dependent oxidoreductase [Acetobacteraceae bacterium]|nr:NAD(P)-dependent oxidoreductase [Acetobacteraceae bacterium]